VEKQTKPYYVILTGSKNNAGDYLIKYRAKRLFASIRPDREIIDIDGWKAFDEKTLELVNNAKALNLMGGPALQKNRYPCIYQLCHHLDDIKVPVVTMGIGWKSHDGAWDKSRNYPLYQTTLELLNKIDASGFKSSVRDYHTLNALQHKGYKSFVMTGCPALNDLEHLTAPKLETGEIKKIAFSLGVSFLESKEMESQMKSLILNLRDYFVNVEIEVIFHHSLEQNFLNTHNATNTHLVGHQKFAEWLSGNSVKYKDISGSAENLIDCYSEVDLHFGYRVHAHIYMTSMGKRSVLISEDGRGKALKFVCDGLILDGVDSILSSFFHKALRKLRISSGYKVASSIPNEAVEQLVYEIENEYPRMRKSQILLKDNFNTMEAFVRQLP